MLNRPHNKISWGSVKGGLGLALPDALARPRKKANCSSGSRAWMVQMRRASHQSTSQRQPSHLLSAIRHVEYRWKWRELLCIQLIYHGFLYHGPAKFGNQAGSSKSTHYARLGEPERGWPVPTSGTKHFLKQDKGDLRKELFFPSPAQRKKEFYFWDTGGLRCLDAE